MRRNMMSKKWFIALFLSLFYSVVFAQGATVIRGEVSPGVYQNITTFSDGRLSTYTQGASGSGVTASSTNPIRQAFQARTSNYTAVSSGQIADSVSTVVGAQIVKPFSIPEADWSYVTAAGGIVGTT